MKEKKIVLRWKPNKEADLIVYRLYWSPIKGLWPFSPIMSVNKDTTRVTMTLPRCAHYYFAVSAVDIAGNESTKTVLTPKTR